MRGERDEKGEGSDRRGTLKMGKVRDRNEGDRVEGKGMRRSR
jgi:hypothetical protein